MSRPVIQIENLGKRYRLGVIGTGTLSHDLNRWLAKVRGKEDPMSQVKTLGRKKVPATGEDVWSLRNLSLEVPEGAVMGVIGRNGAGKSTLLKILSRVTAPTEGIARIRGRLASLLEVGTGFHPELTGRENIFLGGAILGMTRREIRDRFDEIVAFSGIELYVDTPVKRYSSGMYVRLAFAVATHLEADILLIDEVLAVGDAEFQRKCLSKMRDLSNNQGRTVLFVSHDMGAIGTLCDQTLVLGEGRKVFLGDTESALKVYGKQLTLKSNLEMEVNEQMEAQVLFLQLLNANLEPNAAFTHLEAFCLEADVLIRRKMDGMRLSVLLENQRLVRVASLHLPLDQLAPGRHKLHLWVAGGQLVPGPYVIKALVQSPGLGWISGMTDPIGLEVSQIGWPENDLTSPDHGSVVRLQTSWELVN